MIYLIHIHLADAIRWADQRPFHIPCQVAAVKEAKGAELEHEANAVGVVTQVFRLGNHFVA